jgi:hypothetical protein
MPAKIIVSHELRKNPAPAAGIAKKPLQQPIAHSWLAGGRTRETVMSA